MKSRFDQLYEETMEELMAGIKKEFDKIPQLKKQDNDNVTVLQLIKMSEKLKILANKIKSGNLNPVEIRNVSTFLLDIADQYEMDESNKD